MTILHISGMGFPPYATNRCTQTLEAIPQGPFVRTLDGKLVFIGTVLNHKYKSVIQGEDNNTPTLAMLACGQEVVVQCMQSLWEEATGEQVILSRPTTPNTISAVDRQGDDVPLVIEAPQQVRLEEGLISFPVFIQYYPVLKMLVRSFALEAGQENYSTKWRLELEEV